MNLPTWEFLRWCASRHLWVLLVFVGFPIVSGEMAPGATTPSIFEAVRLADGRLFFGFYFRESRYLLVPALNGHFGFHVGINQVREERQPTDKELAQLDADAEETYRIRENAVSQGARSAAVSRDRAQAEDARQAALQRDAKPDPSSKDRAQADAGDWQAAQLERRQRLREIGAGLAALNARQYHGINMPFHFISGKIGSGFDSIIRLEDGSLWRPSPATRINTLLWLPSESVTIIFSPSAFQPFTYVMVVDTAFSDKAADVQYLGGGP